ncbi:MAG: hydroxyacylglutathione hydrolase [Actinomycetota bacterium]|jgi:glyoxylase-like metal-dependent hydrolase (beta-lactamase superfamily II)|nr:hydroxyacylglutathione hydrolase [Actinomycetota bacterium]
MTAAPVPFEIFAHRVVGPLACNCYIIGDAITREAIVVDPGGDADDLAEFVDAQDLKVVQIVATHAHFDHVVAAEELRRFTGAPFRLHPADQVLLDWYMESGRMFLGVELPPPPEIDASVEEGDTLRAGSFELEVLHTPGHSPGSISLVGASAVFSGDSLFASSIGRSDLPGGDDLLLRKMIRGKLFSLGDEMIVLPGHGPQTTIGQERSFNPFVGDRSDTVDPP